MIAIFLGPPGSGKGTQAAMLAERYNLLHFDMGRALRDEIASGSDLGSEIRKYTDLGELVPISVIKMIVEKTLRTKGEVKIILDGFPRSQEQADLLDSVLIDLGTSLDGACYFNLDDSIIVERIVNRRFCPVCKSVYNILFAPPKREGICDRDGELLTTRLDDNETVVKNRLNVYRRETEPILNRYREAGLLNEIDASDDIDDVRKRLENILRLQ
jgi:adenylate kinase